jgi:tRNA pseudouridine38-40 synthase
MVRNIIGTLVMVGKRRLDVAGFREILAARDRRKAGPMAPAGGLCLMRVNY